MVHGQNNNQINFKTRTNREKYGRKREKGAKIGENQPKNTFFGGKNKVLPAGGDTGDVTKLLLHLQGCNGRRLALVPCAKLVDF